MITQKFIFMFKRAKVTSLRDIQIEHVLYCIHFGTPNAKLFFCSLKDFIVERDVTFFRVHNVKQ